MTPLRGGWKRNWRRRSCKRNWRRRSWRSCKRRLQEEVLEVLHHLKTVTDGARATQVERPVAVGHRRKCDGRPPTPRFNAQLPWQVPASRGKREATPHRAGDQLPISIECVGWKLVTDMC